VPIPTLPVVEAINSLVVAVSASFIVFKMKSPTEPYTSIVEACRGCGVLEEYLGEAVGISNIQVTAGVVVPMPTLLEVTVKVGVEEKPTLKVEAAELVKLLPKAKAYWP